MWERCPADAAMAWEGCPGDDLVRSDSSFEGVLMRERRPDDGVIGVGVIAGEGVVERDARETSVFSLWCEAMTFEDQEVRRRSDGGLIGRWMLKVKKLKV